MCGRCDSSYYVKTDRHLKLRSGEHIGISHLTYRNEKQSKKITICDNRLTCNNIPLFDNFTIFTYGRHKNILKNKESFLIKSNIPVLNKNVGSAKIFLFDRNQNFQRFHYIVIFFIMLFDL